MEYIKERCHNDFRWWYEYSGGKMTDWGAHHVDIAQWAIGKSDSGPVKIEIISAEHPVPLVDGYTTVDNTYNTAIAFNIRCLFDNGVELIIRDSSGKPPRERPDPGPAATPAAGPAVSHPASHPASHPTALTGTEDS